VVEDIVKVEKESNLKVRTNCYRLIPKGNSQLSIGVLPPKTLDFPAKVNHETSPVAQV